MVKREFSLRATFGVGDFLHPALELNQDKINSRGGLAGCAVHHCAADRPRLGRCQRSQ
jgi:hypothetical protein